MTLITEVLAELGRMKSSLTYILGGRARRNLWKLIKQNRTLGNSYKKSSSELLMRERFDVNYEMSELQVKVENRLKKKLVLHLSLRPKWKKKSLSYLQPVCVLHRNNTHIRADKERETKGKSFSNKSNILLTQSTVKRHRTSQLKATTEKWSMTTENSEKNKYKLNSGGETSWYVDDLKIYISNIFLTSSHHRHLSPLSLGSRQHSVVVRPANQF